jgi:hypothetical protein
MVGPGASDYGNVGVMPARRVPHTRPADGISFLAKFSHANETAIPGYWAAPLAAPVDTLAELTLCGLNSGIHRYTFAGTAPRVVVFDLGHALAQVRTLVFLLACSYTSMRREFFC